MVLSEICCKNTKINRIFWYFRPIFRTFANDMAQAAVTYDNVMSELKARHFKPIYYLMGEESYYIDKISDWIIIVKEAQNIKNTEPIEKYLKQPMASTILVMCHKNGKIDGRKREYVKSIQQAGVLFESAKMKERDLPSFIERYLSAKGASIDPKSTQLIADSIGSDLSRLTSELDKVLLSLPEGDRRVTPQVVEDQIGVSKDFNGFELRDAIVNRNVYKANLIIKYFDENPKAGSIYAFLPLLFNYFQNLMIAYYCPQKNSQEALAQWLDMKSPWGARDYLTGMRNYTGSKVLQIIGKIREMDAKSKGLDNPNTGPGELMKELIFFIFH